MFYPRFAVDTTQNCGINGGAMLSLRMLYCQLLVLLLLSARVVADGIEEAGNVLQYAMPASAAALTLARRDWEGTWEFGASFALQGVIVLTLKNSVYETRPNGQGHQSFTSGHTAVTFASAEFLRERYGWYYGAPAYALASFTAYSRVESQNHYWHDVIVGAGIGILSSWLFTTSYKDWEIQPATDGKSASLTLLRRW